MQVILLLAAALCANALRFEPEGRAPLTAAGKWYDLFQPPYTQCPTVMIGISCLDSKTCYVPGGRNGKGFDIFLFDGQPGGSFTPLSMPSKPLASLAIGMGGTPTQPHGCAGGFGFGNGVQYAVNATTFKPSITPSLFVMTQDIRAARGGKEVLAVNSAGSNSVLYSGDGGALFEMKKITSPVPADAFARYAALLSPTVWYVTLGNWPHKQRNHRSDRVDITARLSRDLHGGKLHRRRVVNRGLGESNGSYSAAIVKTSDGGKTWTTQYSDTTLGFYFNAIDCTTANVCVAVGEGFDANAGIRIFRTTNGGGTWTQVYHQASSSTKAYSLLSVAYQSTSVVWAAGSVQQAVSSAYFLVSTDAGATWTESGGGVSNIGDISSLSFAADGSGFATAVTIFDDSTILAHTTGPTPPPTPGGTFSQMDCSDSACTQNCRNVTFPTNSCLRVTGGGSAIVRCAPHMLVQQFYSDNPNCQGVSKNTSMPLNRCLQNSQDTYFENFCGSQMHKHR